MPLRFSSCSRVYQQTNPSLTKNSQQASLSEDKSKTKEHQNAQHVQCRGDKDPRECSQLFRPLYFGTTPILSPIPARFSQRTGRKRHMRPCPFLSFALPIVPSVPPTGKIAKEIGGQRMALAISRSRRRIQWLIRSKR